MPNGSLSNLYKVKNEEQKENVDGGEDSADEFQDSFETPHVLVSDFSFLVGFVQTSGTGHKVLLKRDLNDFGFRGTASFAAFSRPT